VEKTMKAHVHITLKKGVLDPQGKAIENALKTLGFDQVKNVRQGKFIEIELDEKDITKAEKQVAKMSEKLLANTVIENYQIDIQENK
jgi:phosphoribosylformylglycinamidine synthase|tara:strand:+ start:342 stop:602 length:261 start_codon:yes stop_codon:yes gene_type:complete